jgi:predicted polyphosphate/ATP-dependent NAD kinase
MRLMRTMNRIPAATRPTSIARMRSKRIVTTMVRTRMNASDFVERRMVRRAWDSTMRAATTTRMPASAASGTADASGAASETIARTISPCEMAARRVRAPERTLTAVRASAAVAGIPPITAAPRFAMP